VAKIRRKKKRSVPRQEEGFGEAEGPRRGVSRKDVLDPVREKGNHQNPTSWARSVLKKNNRGQKGRRSPGPCFLGNQIGKEIERAQEGPLLALVRKTCEGPEPGIESRKRKVSVSAAFQKGKKKLGE